MNTATETVDAIDAVYDALPEGLRKRVWRNNGRHNPGLKKKLKTLYQYYWAVDIKQAVDNIIYNQIEDAVLGRLSGAATKGLAKITNNGNLPGSKLGGLGRIPSDFKIP